MAFIPIILTVIIFSSDLVVDEFQLSQSVVELSIILLVSSFLFFAKNFSGKSERVHGDL